MSEDGMDVIGIMAAVGMVICTMIVLLTPSPMYQCIKAGYNWIDNNCVDRD